MSSKTVSDEFLGHNIERFRTAAFSPSGVDPVWPERMGAALDELLQRRKEGGSPEEFVERMAAQLGQIPETHRAMFLSGLGKMQDGLVDVRRALLRGEWAGPKP